MPATNSVRTHNFSKPLKMESFLLHTLGFFKVFLLDRIFTRPPNSIRFH